MSGKRSQASGPPGWQAKKPRVASQAPVIIDDDIDDGFQPAFVSKSKPISQKAIVAVDSALWVEKYAPTAADALAVNPKKLDDLRACLRECTSSSAARLMVLAGPTGCGKSTALRLIAKELNICITEWLSPVARQFGEVYVRELDYESRLDQFHSFMLRALRYPSLIDDPASKRLILVEDIPLRHNKEKSAQFNQILVRAVRSGKFTIVLVVSGPDGGQFAVRELLPRELRESSATRVLNFQPIGVKMMKKVLEAILSAEKLGNKMSFVQRVIDSSNGDIRSAINSLQYLVRAGKASTLDANDEEMELLHAVGKVLHWGRGKRYEAKQKKREQTGRGRAVLDADEIVSGTGVGAEMFALFLHENGGEMFGELEDMFAAASYFSDSDVVGRNQRDGSLGVSLASTLACQGVVQSNQHPLPSSFNAVHAPKYLAAMRSNTAFHNSALGIVARPHLVPPQVLRGASVELMTSVIPAACAISGYGPLDSLRWLCDTETVQAAQAALVEDEISD
eukprot:TRINITY_DN2163_c0_g2_i1.p1 TRINITY_DN2163_c0_g2~~TRINITY_DN2163_c0_g2_i1.p1  ORF type:complete len:533 (+),score=97.07 TRINITY_DN2163_c0_g2_i1:75-1601(+)